MERHLNSQKQAPFVAQEDSASVDCVLQFGNHFEAQILNMWRLMHLLHSQNSTPFHGILRIGSADNFACPMLCPNLQNDQIYDWGRQTLIRSRNLSSPVVRCLKWIAYCFAPPKLCFFVDLMIQQPEQNSIISHSSYSFCIWPNSEPDCRGERPFGCKTRIESVSVS
jgi:hypothetical protein